MQKRWYFLPECCSLKGIPYNSVSNKRNEWRQPRGGRPDGVLNNRKAWKRETIEEWLEQTDIELQFYKQKNLSTIV